MILCQEVLTFHISGATKHKIVTVLKQEKVNILTCPT